jgi:hypothetical protein
MAELLDIVVADEKEFHDIRQDLTNAQHHMINSVMLQIHGVGEDFFFLNESFPDGKNILDYPTLYDKDFEDFTFQEKWRTEEIVDYKARSYNGSLYFDWARLRVDGEFTYANLCMMAGYIMAELDDYGDDIIGRLIPSEWEEGPEHGKECCDKTSRWDLQQNANGLEKELKQLTRSFQIYLRERLEVMGQEFGELSVSQAFILERNEKDEKNLDFVFTDKGVLAKVRLKSFLRDCRNYEQTDHSILLNRVEEEKILLGKHLEDQHRQIFA